MINQFKVGDRVMIRSGFYDKKYGFGCSCKSWDMENNDTIHTVLSSGNYNWNGCVPCVIVDKAYGGWIPEEVFRLVDREIKLPENFGTLEEFNSQCGVDYGEDFCRSAFTSNKKSIMSNIIDFVKERLLSADEQSLRRNGLKDSCGDYTGTAERLVLTKLIKDNEAYLIEVSKALDEENKKK